MTKDWYPEYIKKYESMKTHTRQKSGQETRKENIFIYGQKLNFIAKEICLHRGEKLNFINNQGNSNEIHSKTQYNSHLIDKYKRWSRTRVCQDMEQCHSTTARGSVNGINALPGSSAWTRKTCFLEQRFSNVWS